MKAHGASFDTATIDADWRGKCRGIKATKGILTSRVIPAAEIAGVNVITNENKTSLGGSIGSAALGGLLAGPAGLIIGGILGGRKTVHLVAVTLMDGEAFVLEASSDEMKQLLGLAVGVANAKNLSSQDDEPPSIDEQIVRRGRGRRTGADEPLPGAPVLKRIVYSENGDHHEAPQRPRPSDALRSYSEKVAQIVRSEVDVEHIVELKELRRQLQLGRKRVALAHALVFVDVLREVTRGDELDEEQALELRQVKERLQRLGWSPGD